MPLSPGRTTLCATAAVLAFFTAAELVHASPSYVFSKAGDMPRNFPQTSALLSHIHRPLIDETGVIHFAAGPESLDLVIGSFAIPSI